MRFLVKVNIPVEAGNGAAKAGKLGTTIQSILADMKPEAVYFTDDNGQRTAFSLPRNAGRLTDPRDCRAVVPRVQCEHLRFIR
jgi:hypothetical protein